MTSAWVSDGDRARRDITKALAAGELIAAIGISSGRTFILRAVGPKRPTEPLVDILADAAVSNPDAAEARAVLIGSEVAS